MIWFVWDVASFYGVPDIIIGFQIILSKSKKHNGAHPSLPGWPGTWKELTKYDMVPPTILLLGYFDCWYIPTKLTALPCPSAPKGQETTRMESPDTILRSPMGWFCPGKATKNEQLEFLGRGKKWTYNYTTDEFLPQTYNTSLALPFTSPSSWPLFHIGSFTWALMKEAWVQTVQPRQKHVLELLSQAMEAPFHCSSLYQL